MEDEQGENPVNQQGSDAARTLGQIRTPKKAASSRTNGKRGGRPRGFSPSEESRRKMSETMKRKANDHSTNAAETLAAVEDLSALLDSPERIEGRYSNLDTPERRRLFDALFQTLRPVQVDALCRIAYDEYPIWFLEKWQSHFPDVPLSKQVEESNRLDMRRDPIGYLERRAEEIHRLAEASNRVQLLQGNSALASILPSESELPSTITNYDLRVSVHSWIQSVGSFIDGTWRAPLPDGRTAVWHPENPTVLIEGSPDRVSLVIRQWVEEPCGDPPYKFAETVLDTHPRWQRALRALKRQNRPLTPDDVLQWLRLDGLPHTPSVISYALAILDQGAIMPPCRGGLVTTFLIEIVFDPDNPDWKDHYPELDISPLLISAVPIAQTIHNGARQSRELRKKQKHHPEILHAITASKNWTTQKFWQRANSCATKHATCLKKRWKEGGDFDEGFMRPGRNEANDWIQQKIQNAIDQGQLSPSSSLNEKRHLVDVILNLEKEQRRHERQTNFSTDYRNFREMVRERINDRIRQIEQEK